MTQANLFDGATLLTIDDTPQNLELISAIFFDKGCRVLEAASGEAGLALAREHVPDLILLDVMMPGIDGYEVCRRLKADPLTRETPVIFLSALSDTSSQVAGFAAGGVDYLAKPFKIPEVIARCDIQLRLLSEIRERRQSERLLKNVLEMSREGIAVLDPSCSTDYRWALANPVMQQILRRDVLTGLSLAETLPEALAPELAELCADARAQGHAEREIFFEGSWYQISAQGLTARSGPDEAPTHSLSLTFRDITPLKELSLMLAKEARQDGLTGLANRRCFDETLRREWDFCARNQLPLSLLLCDVDHFKAYNDTYGHAEGDNCLQQVAQGIAQTVRRPTDLAARYGGEEFAVILPNTPMDGARFVAQMICEKILGLEIPHRDSESSQWVSLSVGVASVIPAQGESSELGQQNLIEASDRALYAAKQGGRNRVELAEQFASID